MRIAARLKRCFGFIRQKFSTKRDWQNGLVCSPRNWLWMRRGFKWWENPAPYWNVFLNLGKFYRSIKGGTSLWRQWSAHTQKPKGLMRAALRQTSVRGRQSSTDGIAPAFGFRYLGCVLYRNKRSIHGKGFENFLYSYRSRCNLLYRLCCSKHHRIVFPGRYMCV